MLITLEKKCTYVLELTIGFESNLVNNEKRKRQKYQHLINELHKSYVKEQRGHLSAHASEGQCVEYANREILAELKIESVNIIVMIKLDIN